MPIGEYRTCRCWVERVGAVSVTVRLARPEPQTVYCGGCRACGLSGTSSLLHLPRQGTRQLLPGQAVVVRRFVVNPAMAAAIVFALPLACMLAGLAAGSAVCDSRADTPGLFVWGVAGLGTGAFFAWLLQRLIDCCTDPPVILDQEADSSPQPQS